MSATTLCGRSTGGPDSKVATTIDYPQLQLTPTVNVLVGIDNGAYPNGNSVLVRGDSESVLIDPSVSVARRGGPPHPVDAVLISHSHEDHMVGLDRFESARVHVHQADRQGVASIDGLREVYGLDDAVWAEFEPTIVDEFEYHPRPDAQAFTDGTVFDLGGLRIEAVHLPGHTRGHSGFRIEGGVFFCSDIDLTGFGPYYGDAWSDLDQFEASLERIRDEEAEYYVTFHHKGVIRGRAEFVERVDAFAEVIDRRHGAMLDFLAEPRTVDEMVSHRFVYRPHVDLSFADAVERRTAELHLQRMVARDEVEAVDHDRYRAR